MKVLVRGTYDLQKLRVAMGNRLTGNFKARLGMKPSTKEKELSKQAKKVLKELRQSYDRITDGIVKLPAPKKFEGDEVISTYAELVMVHGYMNLLEHEESQFKLFEKALSAYPIWTGFLKDVKGCDPAMAGVIISEIDIHKAKYPSSIHAYAGLDVAADGKGRSRRKEHLVDTEYTDKEGKKKMKKGITFNPFLKTKLVGVLGPSFLKCGDRSPYRKIYDDYRHRLESHAKYKDVGDKKKDKGKKGHRHNMAVRYMVKMFLIDLYRVWRELEGLPVSAPYHEAKLGYTHGRKAA